MIALVIVTATGTFVLSILFVTLRVSSKSDKLVNLKQNGNIAVSQIVKQIRYAKSLDDPTFCPATAGSSLSTITITSILDNGKTIFSCGNSTIASNGASLVDTNSVQVTQCSFVCTQPTLNDPPTINLNLTLSSKNASSLVESTASIPFQTSVLMRNVSK